MWEWEKEKLVVGQRPKRAVKILSGGVCRSGRDGRSWGHQRDHDTKYLGGDGGGGAVEASYKYKWLTSSLEYGTVVVVVVVVVNVCNRAHS